MTIHSTHPFVDDDPDPARRFRGRVGGVVTLWTTGEGDARAGLTVTSLMVALGPEPCVLALIDPDSDFLDVVQRTGRAVVQPLAWRDRALAEYFAGTAPAPGGPFRQADFVDTDHGPRLASTTTWAAGRLVGERDMGWSAEIQLAIDDLAIGADDGEGLGHRRGRFERLARA